MGAMIKEGAMKAAFLASAAGHCGNTHSLAEELELVTSNAAPGAPQLLVLLLKGGSQGCMLGLLSTTRLKAIHKLDIPSFDWPALTFPKLKYPLAEYEAVSKAAKETSLKAVTENIVAWKEKAPIAAPIVQPIQSEGGDCHTLPEFFRGLRRITKEHSVFFIADEVQMGFGATGSFWAHSKWNLPEPADFVTFSKKAQASGFYHTLATRPKFPYQQYNTWLGNPIRALQAREMINVIEKHDLVAHTARVGAYVCDSLEALQLDDKIKGKLITLRGKGKGTYIAFDQASKCSALAFLCQP